MGTVWRAWDERLRREARAAARLGHPAIVHVYAAEVGFEGTGVAGPGSWHGERLSQGSFPEGTSRSALRDSPHRVLTEERIVLRVYPDPILTANLYGAERLDEILLQIIGPAWRAVRQHEPGSEAYLWTLRSREGGEHLKLRLHGPASLADTARALLEQAALSFPGRLDAGLVWTRYQRSHACLGGGPFLDDDGYVSRITRCLAAACERVLLLEPDATGRIPLQVRQSILLEGLVAGLAVSGFAADARPAYLEYHRDTLLRSRAEAGRRDDLLELFDRRIEAMAAGALHLTAGSVWTQDSTAAEPEGAVADWCRALAHLVWYIRPLCEDPDYRIDPLAEDPCFVPVFKAFHGFANQLGLNLVEEAFELHFLLAVSAPAPAHVSR